MYQSGIGYKSINPKRSLKGRKKKIEEFIIIDETLIKISSELKWLWVVAIELESKEILGISITKERNMLLAERFISSLVGIHGQHPVSTDGGTWYLFTSL
jgi:putative transposase